MYVNETLLFFEVSVFKEMVVLKHANSYIYNYPLHYMYTHMKTEIHLREEL